jgi:hypothetical protein
MSVEEMVDLPGKSDPERRLIHQIAEERPYTIS